MLNSVKLENQHLVRRITHNGIIINTLHRNKSRHTISYSVATIRYLFLVLTQKESKYEAPYVSCFNKINKIVNMQ